MLHQGLMVTAPRTVWEFGGGCGGDLARWMQCASLRTLDVVEMDPTAIREYSRRLLQTYHAVPEGQGTFWVPRNVDDWLEVRFHCADARQWCEVPTADLAVFSFSASQMFGDRRGFVDFMRTLLHRVRHVLIVAHDHVAAGLPPTPGCGVTIHRVTPPSCCGESAAWWCASHGTAARIRTTVMGSTLAQDIEEWVWSTVDLESALRTAGYTRASAVCEPPTRVRNQLVTSRPYTDDAEAHWLLRSLVMLHVSAVVPNC